MRAMRLRYAAIGLLTYVQSIGMVITASSSSSSSSSSRSSTPDGSRPSSPSASAACRSVHQGSAADFSDLPSRTVRAQVVFIGLATRVRQTPLIGQDTAVIDDATVRYRVRFSVTEVYKGQALLPAVPRRLPNVSEPIVDVIVTSMRPTGNSSPPSSSTACVPVVGSRYFVFAAPLATTSLQMSTTRRTGNSSTSATLLEMSGLPVPYSDRSAKIVKDYSCQKCVRAPRVNMNSDDVTLLAGQRLRLQCRGTGKPQPLITWYKDDTSVIGRRIKVTADSRRSLLQISKVKVEDSGVYSCRGESALGRSELAYVNVIVRDLDMMLKPHTRPCDDQTFCLNGGSCYILLALDQRLCECTANFEGRRCEEKRIGQAVVATEKSSSSLLQKLIQRLQKPIEADRRTDSVLTSGE